MNGISIQPITRDNWEEAIKITVGEHQTSFVPSVIEGIAYAYIKPWDEALDPYMLYTNGELMGFFYLSYTPESEDNYWIGGFQIDKAFQGKGYGKQSMIAIINFIKQQHPQCKVISLTVEKENVRAQSLYKRLSFVDENKMNDCGEVIFRLRL